jgi:hypothetical protein
MLVYASAIPSPLGPESVAQIRTAIARRNPVAGVSGRLLFSDGLFLQVLEGPPDAVRELFDVIRRDARHVRVVELFCLPVAERRYGDFEVRLETRRGSRVFDRFVRYLLHRLPAPMALEDPRRVLLRLRRVLLGPVRTLPEARRDLVAALPSARFASADRDHAAHGQADGSAHAALEALMRRRQPVFRSPANPAYARSKPMAFLSTLPQSLRGADSLS